MIAVLLLISLCGCQGQKGQDAVNIEAESSSEINEEVTSSERITTVEKTTPVETDMTKEETATERTAATESAGEEINTENKEETEMKMNVQIGNASFTATLENNDAVGELVEMMRQEPVTIHMSDYAGFEKVGPLGRSLTTSNHQTTTYAGDIVLYNSNQIVMFYGSNSWSYTRIGKIDDLSGWADALGSGDITAVFSLEE